jgi:succinate dehydrogenase flavin-adding protein (antitoxin of CptAB toxin-antitoxin module)
MKELDELLSRYARERYPLAPPVHQAAFERLLALPDPQIADYLLGYWAASDPEVAEVVAAILART